MKKVPNFMRNSFITYIVAAKVKDGLDRKTKQSQSSNKL